MDNTETVKEPIAGMNDECEQDLTVSEKAKEYQRKNNILFLVDFIFGVGLLVIFLVTSLSIELRRFSSSYSERWWVIVILYILCFGLILTVISFPLTYYKSFFLEQKFNQSNQTLAAWLWEEAKGLFVSTAIGLPLVVGLYALIRSYSVNWWLLAALGWLFFTVVMAHLAPIVIMPLFNKYELIQDEKLKDRIFSLAKQTKVKVRDVLRMDMSKQTRKANAFFTGIGNTKRIVLGDTLLENFNLEETEFVLAHEMAHQRFGHMWKLLAISTATSVFAFYVGHSIMERGVDWFGLNGVADVAGFPLLALTFILLFFILMPLQNAILRRHEREADNFALDITEDPDSMISTMGKLAKQNLADPKPSPIVEFVLHSHPSISKRIARAQEYKNVNNI